MTDCLLYHNPRCSKSRATLALLQERGVEPRLRLYLEQPLDASELRKLLQKLGIGARELLRRSESEYRDMGLADTDLDEERLIEAMVTAPKLMQRPIVERGEQAAIGRPPENVLQLFE